MLTPRHTGRVCSPAACPYRLHTVRVLVGAAEEKGRPLAHETHLGTCGFGGTGARTPSSRGAATGASGWVLPELASGGAAQRAGDVLPVCGHVWEGTQGRCPSLRAPSDPQLEQRTSHLGWFSPLLSLPPPQRADGQWGSLALLIPIPTVPPSLHAQPNHKLAQLKSCPEPARGC